MILYSFFKLKEVFLMTCLADLPNEMHKNLSIFKYYRGLYELSPANTTFFQPFHNLADFQQLIKTILVAPLVGLDFIIMPIPQLIKAFLLFAISMLCMDMKLAEQAVTEFVLNIESMIVIPFIALIVTIGSVVSLLTRGIATVCNVNSDDDDSYHNAF
ncbi:MAG: hypothetical protein EBY16_02060 [Gammaproteobacteria bacterium]|nr:hypothetical protein [Gammaproteobacteria bacterium]